ncbi:LysR family transcriptional regulator [Corynebacterium halotolerans]|uniref:LysR family transcriptional regulator n=1 Tax=Corynebacterium halotolerans YIM 70093 = DSM 44683 TaxID=1121362 RepID=M1N1N0_9CORY|nr:LysR family transcriptional regulator [Corynebacterium halotolerans]AGF73819.1 LysR family transcriptional regulator [Corynebacterium halotolerans YIM 70093 = DSM 44683]
MTINIRHLRALLAIDDTGSMTAAAESLGLTQPSITRIIAELEEHMNLALVTRRKRGTTLTTAGQHLLTGSREAVDAFDTVLSTTGEPKPLRIAYAWSALIPAMERILRSWREDKNHCPVELVRTRSPIASLTAHSCELALVRDWQPQPGFEGLDIAEEPRAVAVASTHPLAGADTIQLKDLEKFGLVTNSYGGTTPIDLWGHPRTHVLDKKTDDIEDWLTIIATDPLVFGMTPVSTAAMYHHPAVSYVPITDAPSVVSTLVWVPDNPSTRQFIVSIRSWKEK